VGTPRRNRKEKQESQCEQENEALPTLARPGSALSLPQPLRPDSPTGLRAPRARVYPHARTRRLLMQAKNEKAFL
jgi:hypothetical protein